MAFDSAIASLLEETKQEMSLKRPRSMCQDTVNKRLRVVHEHGGCFYCGSVLHAWAMCLSRCMHCDGRHEGKRCPALGIEWYMPGSFRMRKSSRVDGNSMAELGAPSAPVFDTVVSDPAAAVMADTVRTETHRGDAEAKTSVMAATAGSTDPRLRGRPASTVPTTHNGTHVNALSPNSAHATVKVESNPTQDAPFALKPFVPHDVSSFFKPGTATVRSGPLPAPLNPHLAMTIDELVNTYSQGASPQLPPRGLEMGGLPTPSLSSPYLGAINTEVPHTRTLAYGGHGTSVQPSNPPGAPEWRSLRATAPLPPQGAMNPDRARMIDTTPTLDVTPMEFDPSLGPERSGPNSMPLRSAPVPSDPVGSGVVRSGTRRSGATRRRSGTTRSGAACSAPVLPPQPSATKHVNGKRDRAYEQQVWTALKQQVETAVEVTAMPGKVSNGAKERNRVKARVDVVLGILKPIILGEVRQDTDPSKAEHLLRQLASLGNEFSE